MEFPWEADEDPYSSVRVVRRDFNSPSTRLTIQKKVQSDGIDFAVIRTSGTEILKVTETDSSGRLLSPEILVKLAKLCEEIEECTNGTYANEDEKIDQLTHVAKTAFDAKSVIEAELFPRTKSSLIRKAWPRSQFAVTVLEGERVIAFQDPLPNRATFTQNQTIRGNREGLREYWCWLDDTLDNGTMANLTVDDKPPPSSLIDARPGLMRVGKRFSRPLAQGEETRVTLCCDLVDAFRTKGQYTFKILRMSKKELFKVQFHRERRCHSIKVFRSYGRVREKLVKEQHFGPDDGEVFEYVVDSPNFGEVYRFEWDW